jgi:lysophospholipase L1-like esterase
VSRPSLGDGDAPRRWTAGPGRALALVLLVLTGAVLTLLGLTLDRRAEAPPRIAPAPLQLVSLGDSLSRGVQPLGDGGREIATDRGYVPRLATALRRRHGRVDVVQAGCGGADVGTLLRGGPCAPRAAVPYAGDGPSSSQVAWAARRLRARSTAPTLVTLNVGGNDLLRCLSPDRRRIRRCLAAQEPGVERGLRRIARTLKGAAGPRTVLVGATVHEPFVGLLRVGVVPRATVLAFHRAIRDRVNPRIARILRDEGWVVADLGRALGGGAPITGRNPRPVRAACDLTWMCALNDVHLNDAGYARAARLFDRVSRAAVDRALGG